MSKKKKILIAVIALLLVAAGVAAWLLTPRKPKEKVLVYSYDMVGYVNFYQGGTESYGMVKTDRVQSEFLSATKTVKEILVYQGQQVKKGDVLYRYDTTLTDMEIERKDLSIQQMELNQKNAEEELKALKKLKPMVLPDEPKEDKNKAETGKSPKDEDLYLKIYEGKGTSYKPYRVWLKKTDVVTEDMIWEYLRERNPDKTEDQFSDVYVVFGVVNSKNTAYEYQYGVRYGVAQQLISGDPIQVAAEGNQNQDPDSGDPENGNPEEEPPVTEDPGTQNPDTEDPGTDNPGENPGGENPGENPVENPGENPGVENPGENPGGENPGENPGGENPPADDPPEEPVPQYKSVLEMSFFDPSNAAHEDDSEIIWNSGYTSSELTAMKNEKSDQIDKLKFDIKMAKAELAIMKKEADNGQVLAQFDGIVASVVEPQNAREMNIPMIKVTGGGGFYVEGSVSELDLGTIQVGQTVTVNSWDTYMTYEGTVVEIGSYPTESENYFSYGSSNVSFYPYKVFIDETADLQEGYYVSMVYQSEPQEEGIMYLENAFLRTDNGESYVYVRNEDKTLEKRVVEVGDSLDGYMTEILSGLSETDYIAFPYGNSVVEGAPTKEGTWDDLYGY